ncbi:hypothetical protein AvCA_28340 [Azotobacter vinelandii CA]|uniref:Uncharacterized protein n=2 Tax=Azotobacter vinelandii TaxID=354 RepID=C1DL04_AZOVD|nr:hypothetical protein Avin_28340 [Azotobacter vinelandii DJ]AGK16536.1 hypothetical protein AvCA_28340 [Azotobacter vinelandii CA]AGK20900.1 hypothetical protein AvCA6_28340 [Azotobacter vinelandii CA6]
MCLPIHECVRMSADGSGIIRAGDFGGTRCGLYCRLRLETVMVETKPRRGPNVSQLS